MDEINKKNYSFSIDTNLVEEMDNRGYNRSLVVNECLKILLDSNEDIRDEFEKRLNEALLNTTKKRQETVKKSHETRRKNKEVNNQ